jgi:winged helix DNA-binding protein
MQIRNEDDAVRFMKTVKFALRYNSTPSLPLASMYAAARDQRLAIELTNALLARNEVVETNVIADRLVLVHRDIVPALYALRVRRRAEKLSDYAERAFRLIQDDGSATAGDVRRYLGVDGLKRPDPGDLALAELQREMLIDRGPSSMPKNGIPYLSKEGYPYRIFAKAHPELVKASKKVDIEDAIGTLVRALGPAPPKKAASVFKLCFSATEMEHALG